MASEVNPASPENAALNDDLPSDLSDEEVEGVAAGGWRKNWSISGCPDGLTGE